MSGEEASVASAVNAGGAPWPLLGRPAPGPGLSAIHTDQCVYIRESPAPTSVISRMTHVLGEKPESTRVGPRVSWLPGRNP